MKFLDLFSEEGLAINLRTAEVWNFPISILRLYLPIFICKKYEANEWIDSIGNIFKISLPSELYLGWDRDCFRIAFRLLGFGIEYYHQWS